MTVLVQREVDWITFSLRKRRFIYTVVVYFTNPLEGQFVSRKKSVFSELQVKEFFLMSLVEYFGTCHNI